MDLQEAFFIICIFVIQDVIPEMSYLYTRMTTDGEETCEDDPAKEGGKHNGMKTNCE